MSVFVGGNTINPPKKCRLKKPQREMNPEKSRVGKEKEGERASVLIFHFSSSQKLKKRKKTNRKVPTKLDPANEGRGATGQKLSVIP